MSADQPITPEQQTALEHVARLGDGAVLVVTRALPAARGMDPALAFARVAEGSQHAALLETADAAGPDGTADMSVVIGSATRVVSGAGALDEAGRTCEVEAVAFDADTPLPAFVGGAVGALAHEHVLRIEPTVPRHAAPHPVAVPDEVFLLVDECVVFSHRHDGPPVAVVTVAGGVLRGIDGTLDDDRAREALERAHRRLIEVERALGEPASPAVETAATSPLPQVARDMDAFHGVESNVPAGSFTTAVAAAREHVRAGECVQVVISQRFSRRCSADPLLVHRALRAVAPAPYHVLLRVGEVHVVAASPEQLVGVRQRRATTHPIAGTRPRGRDSAGDLQLGHELLGDPKERSEHVMLVDLGRNDLARVCRPGSVQVVRLMEVERYARVMHLVSRVEGDLREGVTCADVLRSCFPAGTLTGAPKVRAMQLVAELEPQERGSYGGVVGYFGHGGVMDMAITIRGVLLDGPSQTAHVQAGAGVVAMSDPVSEYEETRAKASAALAALVVAQQASDASTARAAATAAVDRGAT